MGKESTRDIILKAAQTVFVTEGYAATTMRSIAKRAGINKGLLHYYFKTKDALFAEVFQTKFKTLFETLDKLLNSDLPFKNKIERTIDLYIDFMMKEPKLPLFIINEMNRNPKGQANRLKSAGLKPPFKEITSAIDQGKAKGEVKDNLNPRHFVLTMIGLILHPIISKSMLKMIYGLDESGFSQLMQQRKKEITDVLIEMSAP